MSSDLITHEDEKLARMTSRQFTDAEVLAIRADIRSMRVIAKEYSTAYSVINHIKNGRSYKDIKGPPAYISPPIKKKTSTITKVLSTIVKEKTNGQCRLHQLAEFPLPEGCAEVIEFAKSRLTTREQWGFCRVWIEQYLNSYSGK